jgi:site-specific recombinase XerD
MAALRRKFDYCIDQQVIRASPVKPRHGPRRSRSLAKGLMKAQVEALGAQMHRPMDKALLLLMLRCGLQVSAVAPLKRRDIHWSQQAVRIEHGKGRKDRQIYLSADAVGIMVAQPCDRCSSPSVTGAIVAHNEDSRHDPRPRVDTIGDQC